MSGSRGRAKTAGSNLQRTIAIAQKAATHTADLGAIDSLKRLRAEALLTITVFTK